MTQDRPFSFHRVPRGTPYQKCHARCLLKCAGLVRCESRSRSWTSTFQKGNNLVPRGTSPVSDWPAIVRDGKATPAVKRHLGIFRIECHISRGTVALQLCGRK